MIVKIIVIAYLVICIGMIIHCILTDDGEVITF